MEATWPEFEATVPGLIRHRAERSAEAPCLITSAGQLTYGELDRRSANLAAALVAVGVGKRSRVAVLLPNGPEWVVAWAAASRLGAVVLPVNTFYAPPELGRFLRHADVQVLLGVATFLGHDYLADLELLAPDLPANGRAGSPELHSAALPHLRRVLLWEGSAPSWAEGGFGARAEDDEQAAALDRVRAGMEAAVTPADEAVVIYTSGSTGDPKGVVHGHGPLVRHACNLAAVSGVQPHDRLWTSMPFCWVGGLSFVLLRAMAVGAATVTDARFEPGETLALLARARVTAANAWPAACKALVDHPAFATTDLSAMRSGGLYAALPEGRRPPDPGLALGSLGMTETAGPHTYFTAAEGEAGAPEEYRGAFGHSLPGIEHRIVDPDTGADLPEGEPGEVLVRGYSLMLGLYKVERSDVFDADGWYHTGDRGYFDDGWFFFVERQTEMIKTKGSNVSPSEVESALLALPDVKLAFVVPVPHPDRGQDVVGLVVRWAEAPPVADRAAEAASMRRALRSHLAAYKVPRSIEIIDDADVPWLASQKADRRALRTLAEKRAPS